MRWAQPLIAGTLIRRYKRFLADVELDDGRRLTVHCANPGAMTTSAEPGRPVLLSDSGNPKRKLRYSLEMVRMGRTWVGVNTARPNRVIADFVRRGRVAELAGYPTLRTEVRYGRDGRSRVDLLLQARDRRDCYVEIKNATFRQPDGSVAFPDAVTERGRRHLEDLAAAVAEGHRAVIFFHVGRADADRFRPADEVDPAYGRALRAAVGTGVEPLAYRMRFSRRGIALDGRLPIDL